MLIAALAKVDAASNANRYYDIEISRDLFGEWAVIRKWGRIGASPKQKRDACVNEQAARALAQEIKARKERKGYFQRSDEDRIKSRPWMICRGSAKRPAIPLATWSPLHAEETWREVEEIQNILFAFCLARSQNLNKSETHSYGSSNSLFQYNDDTILDTIAYRIVRLLSSGDTINDMFTRLIVGQSISMINAESRDRQKPPRSNVVKMVPSSLHPYLNYSIASFFAKVKGSDAITARLSEAGILRVADLVQRTESDVLQILIHPGAMATVRQMLTDVGLRFEMWIPLRQQNKQIA